ncbi:MAG TPA: MarR family transcriptional regulator [Longimicrobiales bacterium]
MEETTTTLVERFGLRFEADGLPRIAGRMLGLLMVSATPRSMDELAEELQASKTSVNTNARLLERLGAVERATKPGDRRDYYRVVDNLHERMLDARLEQMKTTRDLLSQAVSCCESREREVHARLCSFAKFYDDMVAVLETAKQRWFDERNEQPARERAG